MTKKSFWMAIGIGVVGLMGFGTNGVPGEPEFQQQRNVVRAAELQATADMYDVYKYCSGFEADVAVLLGAVGNQMPSTASLLNLTSSWLRGSLSKPLPVQARGFSPSPATPVTPAIPAAAPAPTARTLDTSRGMPALFSATDLGFPDDIAKVINASTELLDLANATYQAAQVCKPYYAKWMNSEGQDRQAIESWIAMTNKADPAITAENRVEAYGMWVASKIRQAARSPMHTTIPALDTMTCSGDLFLDQSIPNTFKALAHNDPKLLQKSLAEIIQQTQCLDAQQLATLDSAVYWGALSAMLALTAPADTPLLRHQMEAVVMIGTPILEATKVLGPTALNALVQTLLDKSKSAPEVWVLSPSSYLVTHGVTVADRRQGNASIIPICAEDAPPPYTAPAPVLNLPTTAPSALPAAISGASPFTATALSPGTEPPPAIVTVAPEDGLLAYGFSIKDLKPLICPVKPAPEVIPSKIGPPGTIAKVSQGGCYPAKAVIDSYRGDHLGYAVCDLPEMLASGRVCKTVLCTMSLPPEQMPTGGGAEPPGAMPGPAGGSACELPIFNGIPQECKSLGGPGKTTLFAHATDNAGCGGINPLTSGAAASCPPGVDVCGDEMEITGNKPPPPPAGNTSPQAGPPPKDKDPVDVWVNGLGKPSKPETPPAGGSANSNPAAAAAGASKGVPTLPKPAKTPVGAKDLDLYYGGYKKLPAGIPKLKEAPITTYEQLMQAMEDLDAAKQKFNVLVQDKVSQLPARCQLPGVNCKILLDDEEREAYQTALALLQHILTSIVHYEFKPVTTLQALYARLQRIQYYSQCGNVICRLYTAQLRDQLEKSPFYQQFFKDAKDKAYAVLKNPKYREIVKAAREKALGYKLDPNAFNTAYDAMLTLFNGNASSRLYLSAYEDGRMGSANIYSLMADVYVPEHTNMSAGELKDNVVQTLLRGFSLSILSSLLNQLGYSGMGALDSAVAANIDKATGLNLTKTADSHPLAGVFENLRDATQRILGPGYVQQFLDSHTPSSVGTYQQFLGGGGGGGSTTAGNTNKGGGSNTGTGGGGQKSCPPDMPECGGLTKCQLVSMAAVAQCDMAMGKPVLKMPPGGGLILPEPKKLDQSVEKWFDCMFPNANATNENNCPATSCADGFEAVKDKATGQCSCKPKGSGGASMEGYKGGPDICQQIMVNCDANPESPCCANRLGSQQRMGTGGSFDKRAVPDTLQRAAPRGGPTEDPSRRGPPTR